MRNNSLVLGSAGLVLAVLFFGNVADAAMERPVDKKLFCGSGREGHQAAIDYIKTRSENDLSIDRLTPEFACGLAEFLKAAPPAIGVNVGWYEVAASVATHGVSYCQHYQCKEGTNSHPRGLAADLLYGGTKGPGGPGASAWCRQNQLCTWAHQNASAHGLMFRLMPESGCAAGYFEPWHIELKGVGGCQGSDTFGGGSSASAAPLGLGNAFRSLLGGQNQAPSFVQPALPSTQSVISTFAPGASYAPADVSETTATPVSSQITGGTNTGTATSAADRLAALAFGENKAQQNPTSSVPLVVTGANAAGLVAETHTAPAAPVPSSGISQASQQTFVSGDLGWQNTASFSQGPVSGIQAILISIKATLLRLLSYLEPFSLRERPEAN